MDNQAFAYSIVIRTLGNTGEKYLTMLKAIEKQTVRPKEIIVALPHGYTLDHTLGIEKIVCCEKGMVSQRVAGINAATCDYLLVLDDDLDFPPDFAEQQYIAMQERGLDCVLTFGDYEIEGIGGKGADAPAGAQKMRQQALRLRRAFTGQAFYSHSKSTFFDTIASTGGHRTYVDNEKGLCQTGCFQCFFIKREKAQDTHFEDELWLQQGSISSYAAYDDAVFFYKFYLNGGHIAYSRNTAFKHLDAAAGRIAKSRIEQKRIRVYSIARNRTIFWHRHIWGNRHSLRNLIGGWYGIINYALYNIAINILPKNWPAIAAMFIGYREAFSFIRNSKK